MKTAIVLLALVAAACAQGDRVHVVENADQGVDSAFYRPTQGDQIVIPNPDPFFSQPHGPSNGYEPISTGPAYVDNGEVRPSLPYPYKQYPNGGRGGK